MSTNQTKDERKKRSLDLKKRYHIKSQKRLQRS